MLSTVDILAPGSPVVATLATAAPVAGPVVPSALPDRVSAGLAARRAGRRVKVDGEGSASSQTFANPDGSFTVEASAAGAFRRDGAGRDADRWVPLSGDLSGAGTAADPWVAAGLARPVTMGRDASRLLSVSVPGGRAVLSAAGLRLGAPTRSGSSVTFPDAAAETDLQLAVTPSGVKTNLMLKSAAAPHSFRFHLADAGGLLGSVKEQDDGSWLFGRDLGDGYRLALAPATAYSPALLGDLGPGVDRSSASQTVVRAGDGWDLTLAVDAKWLVGKPFPVVLDPSPVFVSSWPGGHPDCHIASGGSNGTTSWCGETTRDVGFGLTSIRRTIAAYNLTSIPTTAVVSAADLDLALVFGSGLGSGLGMNAYRMTAGWTSGMTWLSNGAAPWTPGGVFDSSTVIGSATVGPANGHYHWAVSTATVQGWVNHTLANAGLILTSTNEATVAIARFGSSNNTDASLRPRLSVTYNTPPGQPAGLSARPCSAQCTGTILVSSARPDLTARTTDADGEALRYDFEVWAGHAASPTTLVTSGQVPNVPSGQVATFTVPAGALTTGDYEYRVRAYDGTMFGAWSAGWTMFTVDTSPPHSLIWLTTPDSLLANQWGNASSGSISWTASGASGHSWQLDDDAWSAWSPSPGASLSGLSDGLHRFSVRMQDQAGNVSAPAVRTFGVGIGGIISPADNDVTQARVALSAVASAGRDWLTWRFTVARTDGSFADGLVAATAPGSSDPAFYPVGRDPASTETPKAFPVLTWDAVAQAGDAVDGLVHVRACFGTSLSDLHPVCVTSRTVQLSRAGFASAHATAAVGPGTVSLLTGDFQVSESDVDVPTYQGSLSVGRTLTTLSPSALTTGATGIFGPGWVASLPGPDAGAAAMTLGDSSAQGSVTLTAEDGSVDVYAQQGTTSTFAGVGEAGSDGSKLVKDSATQFTLTDIDGTRTVWTKDAGGHWGPSQVVEPGSASTTSYTRDSGGRVTQILAPVPAGVTCTAPLTTAGCRSLTLVYAASTTATGTAPAQWGDFTGRLSRVNFTAYDPASASMQTIAVSNYAYDSAGMLRAQWDPRISPALKTTYAYDGANRLTTVTPPGLAAWTLSYDSAHRLVAASRPDPSGATATATVRYDVPFTGAGAPVELGKAETDEWGQTDLPTAAAAVWEPDRLPAATPTATDWQYATLTYLDVNGRSVNTASYGDGAWQISTTEYDGKGNTVRTLSAANRNDAIDPSLDQWSDPYLQVIDDSAQRALLLSEITRYDAEGIDITDTLSPIHPVVLDDGTTVSARAHTTTVYDQAAPSGGPFHLPTTVTTTAQTPDGVDHDGRVTTSGYDPVVAGDPSGWTLHAATVSTTDPGSAPHLNQTTKTRYNAAGQTVESRTPAEPSGGGPGTTLTTYYTATGSAPCGGKPQWAGLACRSAPAAQPATGNPLPVSTTTYTIWDASATAVEAFGATTRTATTTYDDAGRATGRSLVVSPPADGGAAVPDMTTGYNSTTGLPTTTSTSAGTITVGYDTLGRSTSYTQTDGGGTMVSSAARTYDLAGRLATLNDGKGVSTYSYDTAADHRGLLTGVSDTQAGAFGGEYNADGTLDTQTYPGGLTAETAFDNAGSPIQLQYLKSGTTWLTFSQTESVHGQVRQSAGPASEQIYAYDPAGRLARVDDATPAACTRRGYTFTAATNRSGLMTTVGTSTAADPADLCDLTGATPTTTAYTYDTADRATDPGYAYDRLGRTTSAPAGAVTGGAALTAGYYANDLVASMTQSGRTRGYTLDPTQNRPAAITDTAGPTFTDHYTDSGDSPAWTGSSDGTWTRQLSGPAGGLAAITKNDGTVDLQLANLHGDVVATCAPADTAPAAYFESTEYGTPRDSNTTTPRYGWLGTHQRDTTNTLAGLTLMGVRLYNPTTGRFLQTDPQPGGSCNDYDYTCADPVNAFDLDGNRCWRCLLRNRYLRGAVVVVGVGLVCGASAGVGCAIAAGAAIGSGLGLANYRLNTRYRSRGGYARAGFWGGVFGAVVGRYSFRSGYFGRGRELAFGRNFRIGLGKWWGRGPWYTRIPHYHLRRPGPGGSMKWHRPWQRGFI